MEIKIKLQLKIKNMIAPKWVERNLDLEIYRER